MLYQEGIASLGYRKNEKNVRIYGEAFGLTHRCINTYSGKTNYHAQVITLAIEFKNESFVDEGKIKKIVKKSFNERKTKLKYNNVMSVVKGKSKFEGIAEMWYITIYNVKISAGVGYDIYAFWLDELENLFEENRLFGEHLKVCYEDGVCGMCGKTKKYSSRLCDKHEKKYEDIHHDLQGIGAKGKAEGKLGIE